MSTREAETDIAKGTCRVVLFTREQGGLPWAPQPRWQTTAWICDVHYDGGGLFGCWFELATASAPLVPGGPPVTMEFRLTLPTMREHVVLGRPMQLFRGIGTVEFLAWAD